MKSSIGSSADCIRPCAPWNDILQLLPPRRGHISLRGDFRLKDKYLMLACALPIMMFGLIKRYIIVKPMYLMAYYSMCPIVAERLRILSKQIC